MYIALKVEAFSKPAGYFGNDVTESVVVKEL